MKRETAVAGLALVSGSAGAASSVLFLFGFIKPILGNRYGPGVIPY